MSASTQPPRQWVQYNPLTATYDTPDGTHVSQDLVDNATNLLDVFFIADIREKQRAAALKMKGGVA